MRRLIRVGYLITAGLGLLVTLAAVWVTQQRVVVFDVVCFSAYTDQFGWHFSWHPRLDNGVGIRVVNDEDHSHADYSRLWFKRSWLLPGIAFRQPPLLWIMVRHWLVIVFFAMFNIVPWWLRYRKIKDLLCDG